MSSDSRDARSLCDNSVVPGPDLNAKVFLRLGRTIYDDGSPVPISELYRLAV